MKKNEVKTDVYQEVTDKLIDMIEKGCMPWRKDWKDGVRGAGLNGMPFNVASKKQYNGINVVLLWAEAQAKGYQSARWGTYKQITDAGGQVRKGEKSTAIVFFKPLKLKAKEAGGPDRMIPLIRSFKVFNIDQCDGFEATVPVVAAPIGSHEATDTFIAATGAEIKFGGVQAFYSPLHDYIGMPQKEAFKSANGFYATAVHELTHWTGHKSRLNRQFGERFGNDAYAFEELVAELGSAFVCAELGAPSHIESHASYLDHWLTILRKDKKAFFKAASEANKAATYLKDLAATKAEEARA